jgi:DcrB
MMTLMNYRHPSAGFSLPLPEAWERIDDTPGVPLVAVQPDRDGWFRASVVVTIEKLTPGATLAESMTSGDELLERALQRYVRIDDEPVEMDGRPARRVLAHHTTEEGHAVTMEQWTLVENGCGYTLTASAGTLDYDQVADLFTTMAEGFLPDPGYRPW